MVPALEKWTSLTLHMTTDSFNRSKGYKLSVWRIFFCAGSKSASGSRYVTMQRSCMVTYLRQVIHELSSNPCWIRAEGANSHEVEDVAVQRKARTRLHFTVSGRGFHICSKQTERNWTLALTWRGFLTGVGPNSVGVSRSTVKHDDLLGLIWIWIQAVLVSKNKLNLNLQGHGGVGGYPLWLMIKKTNLSERWDDSQLWNLHPASKHGFFFML